jgi:D-tyrosyl-tRNA(Tyr) deacylase
MKVVLQRVSKATVSVAGKSVGEIEAGLMVLLGIGRNDQEAHALSMVEKILRLRIFEDAVGKMNLSLQDVKGGLLVVSQFTLYGNCEKGRRPSFGDAGSPEEAERLYDFFVAEARRRHEKVETGTFAAKMAVSLVNEGPVTFTLEL